jgi:5,10-methylenetetrahydrofolate reductase
VSEASEASASLLARLESERPLIAVELRPPRADLSHRRTIDSWIDMHHAVRRLVKRDTYVFLTDNAVGENEEENLHHLRTNLAQAVDPARLVPFLTCKHALDYCLMHADRALSNGHAALTVLGGDKEIGAPRCVAHAYQLREQIRQRTPGLALGGWANPHRDASQQLGFLEASDFSADFFLTQVVSHHDLPAVEAFVTELRQREYPLKGVFGVFYYRSAKARTLKRLAKFLPVPAAQITAEFEAGAKPTDICARTIRALRDLGVTHVYVSNLAFSRAPAVLRRVEDLLAS